MLVYANHRISPFEGSPRAGAAEYVQKGDVLFASWRSGVCALVNNQIRKSNKKIPISQKKRLPFLGAVLFVKKNIDELIILNYFVEVSFKHPHVLFLTRDEVAH